MSASVSFLRSLLYLLLTAALLCQAAAAGAATDAAGYVVLLQEPPAALYSGGQARFAPTAPAVTGEDKLDVNNAAVQSYVHYLTQQQDAVIAQLQSVTRSAAAVTHRYTVTLNGFAAKLSPAQAAAAAKIPGVAKVLPDRKRYPLTDAGPEWIEAGSVWNGLVSSSFKGEGIVVGVIDTGINPANPSFADVGGDGYEHTNPRGKHYGVCDPGSGVYDAQYTCNDKLIGMWSFVSGVEGAASPIDVHAHGSHVASTAAGNVVAASVQGNTATMIRNISGVAPHANIIAYRGLDEDGGIESWLAACVEQAVTDQVDVINYSVGGGISDPWNSIDSLSFLSARAAGVFVSTSGGNSGPDPDTLGSPAVAPWLLTVANSTHNREIINTLQDMSGGVTPPADINGAGFTAGYGPASIVYAGDYANPNDTQYESRLCNEAFPAGTFNGEIVVCDRGNIARVGKGKNVLDGGAGGMVLANAESDGDSVVSDDHYLPATHVTYNQGLSLKNWLASGAGHTAMLAGWSANLNDSLGDIMNSSSSRGYNSEVPDVVKPDVAAPGTNILAAGGVDNEIKYQFMSGTSMASPHTAGAAALLIGLHPDWSMAQVQSALMTTGVTTLLKEDETTPADPFDIGAGRVDLSQAARAGLYLEVTSSEFQNADPSLGGDPSELNLPSMGRETYINTTQWTRTVTNGLSTTETWTASVDNPVGVFLDVSPAAFTLNPGESQKVTVSLTTDSNLVRYFWAYGAVTFTPATDSCPATRLPVAAMSKNRSGADSLALTGKAASGSTTISLQAIEITDFTASVTGMVPGVDYVNQLAQDPTPTISDSSAGEWIIPFTVPDGATYVAATVAQTTSPDIDLYIVDAQGNLLSRSANDGNDEFAAFRNPAAGDYSVFVQNFQASDPTGAAKDNVTISLGVVYGDDEENMSATIAGGATAVPEEQEFGLQLAWNVNAATSTRWFGTVTMGPDAANPDQLGSIDVYLQLDDANARLQPAYQLLLLK